MRRWWRAALLMAILGGLLLALPAGAAEGPGPLQVRALIRAVNEATLSSELPGRLLRVALREGEAFRKGERLVEFDCNSFQAQQAVAQAELRRSQAKLEGLEAMASLRSAGAVELALARADVDKARAEVRSAGLMVERCVIVAPFAGRVVELKVHAHESVPSGAPLLAIVDDRQLEVTMVVPAAWLGWLAPGRRFTLALDGSSQTFQGQLTRLGAQVDPVSQTLTVYGAVTEPPPGVIPGLTATVTFPAP